MELRDWLVFIHILAGIIWVGGVLLSGLLNLRAARSGDPHQAAEGARTAAFVALAVFFPAMTVSLLSGVTLVLDSEVWDFSMGWILFALIVVLASLALLFGFYRPQVERALAIYDERGPDPEMAAIGRRVGIVSQIHALFLIGVVFAMVFKPGA